MSMESLVAAMNGYDVRKRLLEPERYIGLDLLREMLPEYFPAFVPGGAPPDIGAMARRAELFTALLAGEPVDDAAMQRELGFTSEELRLALRDADPIRSPLPEKLVLMTFDDATLDHYREACPLLEEYGFHANLFACEMERGMFGSSGFSDKERYMTWEQLRELSDRGHEICNHTLHHYWDFPTRSLAEKRAEIEGLESRCAEYGIPKPTVFGAPGGDLDPGTESLLVELGYRWGRGSRRGYTPLFKGDALYDPHIDSPLVAPADQMIFDQEGLKSALDKARDKVLIMVFHEINDRHIPGPVFSDCLRTIRDAGGRCITFRELERYVDPVRARSYVAGAYRPLE